MASLFTFVLQGRKYSRKVSVPNTFSFPEESSNQKPPEEMRKVDIQKSISIGPEGIDGKRKADSMESWLMGICKDCNDSANCSTLGTTRHTSIRIFFEGLHLFCFELWRRIMQLIEQCSRFILSYISITKLRLQRRVSSWKAGITILPFHELLLQYIRKGLMSAHPNQMLKGSDTFDLWGRCVLKAYFNHFYRDPRLVSEPIEWDGINVGNSCTNLVQNPSLWICILL